MASLPGNIVTNFHVTPHKISFTFSYFYSMVYLVCLKKYKNIYLCLLLVFLFEVMASPFFVRVTPNNDVVNFKQRGGESLKDAWYKIWYAQNKVTNKLSTITLLHNFKLV